LGHSQIQPIAFIPFVGLPILVVVGQGAAAVRCESESTQAATFFHGESAKALRLGRDRLHGLGWNAVTATVISIQHSPTVTRPEAQGRDHFVICRDPPIEPE
jgi:hypothetical protein